MEMALVQARGHTHILTRPRDLREICIPRFQPLRAISLLHICCITRQGCFIHFLLFPRLQRGENIYGCISIALTLGRRY